MGISPLNRIFQDGILNMKKNRIAFCLALVLLLSLLSGCATKEITMESLLPRTNVIKASVAYLNVGLGEDIPSLSYETIATECGDLCDILYSATPVVLDLGETTYSPELNATHEIGLTTSAGTLKLYYDDYQNLISVPTVKGMDEGNVRVYQNFQTTGLSELLSLWQGNLPVNEPEPATEELPVEEPVEDDVFIAPDDSSLRSLIDVTLLSEAGDEVAFENADYDQFAAVDVFYAFGYHEMDTLPESKVLLVAAAAEGTGLKCGISRVEVNGTYVKVYVTRSQLADGEVNGAALIERASVDLGKPIVFLDDTETVLYVQLLSIPGEAAETVDPEAEMEEAETAPEEAAE